MEKLRSVPVFPPLEGAFSSTSRQDLPRDDSGWDTSLRCTAPAACPGDYPILRTTWSHLLLIASADFRLDLYTHRQALALASSQSSVSAKYSEIYITPHTDRRDRNRGLVATTAAQSLVQQILDLKKLPKIRRNRV